MIDICRLAYDCSEYGNITFLRTNADNVWIPDIIAYNQNNAQEDMFLDRSKSSNALIYPSGEVLWVPDVYEEVLKLFYKT